MVKITTKPWQEVVVHEAIKHDLKDLLRNKVLGLRQGQIAEPLMWAAGVLFSRSLMPPTEDVVRDQLKGIIHLSAVEFAIMPKYRRILKSEGVTIPVIDVTSTKALRDLAKQLRKARPE